MRASTLVLALWLSTTNSRRLGDYDGVDQSIFPLPHIPDIPDIPVTPEFLGVWQRMNYERELNEQNYAHNTFVFCRQPPPSYIEVTLYHHDGTMFKKISTERGQHKLTAPNGTLAEIKCVLEFHVDNTVTIEKDGHELEINIGGPRHGYTEKISLESPEETFVCTVFNCKRHPIFHNKCERPEECSPETSERSVTIEVTPRFDVLGPNVEQAGDNYIVEYGYSLSVLCRNLGLTLLAEHESNTTIEHYTEKPDHHASEYVCVDVNATHSTRVTIQVIPKIYFQIENVTITPLHAFTEPGFNDHNVLVYVLEYRESMELFCSGPRAVILQEKKEKETSRGGHTHIPAPDDFTVNVNETTVKINKKLEAGILFIECGDGENLDNNRVVRVEIRPRIEVRSPNARRVGHDNDAGTPTYAVKYGEPYEIICSGGPGVILSSEYYNSDDRDDSYTETYEYDYYEGRNNSFIRRDPAHREDSSYKCFSSNIQYSTASVKVGVPPPDEDVMHFECTSRRQQHFRCSWLTWRYELNFALFYINNGIPTFICRPYNHFDLRSCTWDSWDFKYADKKNNTEVVSFVMETCNSFGCSNQTFLVDRVSMEKLEPPTGLTVLNTTSRGAVLRWNRTTFQRGDIHFETATEDLFYKVQYKYSDIDPQEIQPMSVKCLTYCEIELLLFCPNEYYEVKIYQKLKKADGDRYWSEPSSLSFATEVGNYSNDNINETDPVCRVDTPRMEVYSPNARFISSHEGVNQYGIKYGDPLEIICSGNEFVQLSLYTIPYNDNDLVDAIEAKVNETTKRFLVTKKLDVDENVKYACRAKYKFVEKLAHVLVGVLPGSVSDFRCSVQLMRHVICNWTATSHAVNFTLSHVENGTRICETQSSDKTKSCVTNYNDRLRDIKMFSIILESCNSVGCSNQTFNVDLSVFKLAPPLALTVNKTTHGIMIWWDATNMYCAGERLSSHAGDIVYKVQSPGIRAVDSSMVSCDHQYCKTELPCWYPYPYQVQIYQKLEKSGEEFWSDPSVTYVFSCRHKHDEISSQPHDKTESGGSLGIYALVGIASAFILFFILCTLRNCK